MADINLKSVHIKNLNNILMSTILKYAKLQLIHLSHIDCASLCLKTIQQLKPFITKLGYAEQLAKILYIIKNPMTIHINYHKLNINDFLVKRFLTIFFQFAHGKPFGDMKAWKDNDITFVALTAEIYNDWKHLHNIK